MSTKRVIVGMSGGVDSSVSAYLLKQQGYEVIGLFMKNWEETDESGCCTSAQDYNDVKRVCEALDIPYYSINFSKHYMDKVFAQFLEGLKLGITPNPDILCNREIKFGPFLDFAEKMGADFIATGHYARVTHNSKSVLHKAIDNTKDQSYFLCGLSQKQLSKVLFPVGEMPKTKVREIAKKLNLVTATKRDSTGICFIGERNFKDFMRKYLGDKPGEMRTLDEKVVGKHTGLMYYTTGQRKGLGLGGVAGESESRWFVVRKDIANNVLYVSCGDCKELYSKRLICKKFNWIAGVAPTESGHNYTAKTRYRQADQKCKIEVLCDGGAMVTFGEPQRAVTLGQWCVLYVGDVCLGGGEITEVLHE